MRRLVKGNGMSTPSPPKDLSLTWLELFQICARDGSLQAASRTTGLSVSTVSHHLRSLEAHLGVDLFDHSRRPMVLTPKGSAFLLGIEEALRSIRKARAENVGSVSFINNFQLKDLSDFKR